MLVFMLLLLLFDFKIKIYLQEEEQPPAEGRVENMIRLARGMEDRVAAVVSYIILYLCAGVKYSCHET